MSLSQKTSLVQFHRPDQPYTSHRRVSLPAILEALKQTRGFPVVLLNTDNSLFGVVSNGDIATYLARHPDRSLDEIGAEDVANQSPVCGHVRDSVETIEAYLAPERIRTLPILDGNRHVVRVVTRQKPYVEIGGRCVMEGCQPFLLAEIGVNHNGDLDEARALVEAAAQAGFDGVKFQHRGAGLYNVSDINKFDLGTQYIISEIERTRLSIEALKTCCEQARSLGLATVITPFDEEALQAVLDHGLQPDALKIASCDLTNGPLIKRCGETDRPLVLSTGMSYERDIRATSQQLRRLMVPHGFLHCNSTYPAPAHDVNLAYIQRLREMTSTVVGYSSHDGDPVIPVSAVACGADLVEVHITRSRDAKGSDHRASLELHRLADFVKQCRLVHEARGNANPRVPTQGELANRQSLGKSYALREARPNGHRLTREDLILISPGSGFTVEARDELLGRSLRRDVPARTLLSSSDLEGADDGSMGNLTDLASTFKTLGYLVGVPVRYHDAEQLAASFGLPLLEFHMSDRDLDLDPGDFIRRAWPGVTLVIHAVEQYEDGFILDLASGDAAVLQRSMDEIERLTRHVDRLRPYFRPAERVPVVLNIGGFSTEAFMDQETERQALRTAVASLEHLQQAHPGYEFLPQTMPPFPWHQGGRSFHNLLTSQGRIHAFLDQSTADLCFDVSHTALACTHFGESIEHVAASVANRVRHVHLSDAQGTNAEGLEVGDGSLNFRRLHNAMHQGGRELLMMPEIWQGHINGGQKFARSLTRYLELVSEA